MSDNDNPIDVFANLGALLGEDSNEEHQVKPKVVIPEFNEAGSATQSMPKDSFNKERIREVAESVQFQSRQAIPKKKKILSKTFSLHQQEYDVIGQGIRNYAQYFTDSYSLPSGSDVVRAALHLFAMQPESLQADMIKHYRARGK